MYPLINGQTRGANLGDTSPLRIPPKGANQVVNIWEVREVDGSVGYSTMTLPTKEPEVHTTAKPKDKSKTDNDKFLF